MLSSNPNPDPERVSTSFSVDQGKPVGFSLDHARSLPSVEGNPFYERKIETGRRRPDPAKVAAMLHETSFLREEIEIPDNIVLGDE